MKKLVIGIDFIFKETKKWIMKIKSYNLRVYGIEIDEIMIFLFFIIKCTQIAI